MLSGQKSEYNVDFTNSFTAAKYYNILMVSREIILRMAEYQRDTIDYDVMAVKVVKATDFF